MGGPSPKNTCAPCTDHGVAEKAGQDLQASVSQVSTLLGPQFGADVPSDCIITGSGAKTGKNKQPCFEKWPDSQRTKLAFMITDSVGVCVCVLIFLPTADCLTRFQGRPSHLHSAMIPNTPDAKTVIPKKMSLSGEYVLIFWRCANRRPSYPGLPAELAAVAMGMAQLFGITKRELVDNMFRNHADDTIEQKQSR